MSYHRTIDRADRASDATIQEFRRDMKQPLSDATINHIKRVRNTDHPRYRQIVKLLNEAEYAWLLDAMRTDLEEENRKGFGHV